MRHAAAAAVVGWIALNGASPSTKAPAGRDGTSAAPEPIRKLSHLIGTWDVEDEHQPVEGPPMRESGVRVCTLTLQDQYLECRTNAQDASGGRRREYRWFINFNADARRYELVALFSNFTGKDFKTFRTDETGRTWNIRNASTSIDDGVERWHWATLVFEGDDRAVWTGYRNAETDSPHAWARSSRETWVRRSH